MSCLKKINQLELCELFSFSKDGAVHMVVSIKSHQIVYKSYNDGKTRIEPTNREKPIFTRLDFEKRYELKWFKSEL